MANMHVYKYVHEGKSVWHYGLVDHVAYACLLCFMATSLPCDLRIFTKPPVLDH